MVRVGIIGASGYAGAELTRYLLGHPGAQITLLASDTSAGKPLSSVYPSFLGQDLPICESFDLETHADRADLFFHCQGNGNGMKVAPGLLEYGKKFIDVPADFRLKDLAVYKEHYSLDHAAPELVEEAVYGVPELHAAEIKAARIIANPGCYATSAVLALAPLVKGKLVDLGSIILDSKSGVSGAGRSKVTVDSIFSEINEGFKAYAVAKHRHTPEIEQELSVLAGENVMLNFTPHLVPMNRGILTTAYASWTGAQIPDTDKIVKVFRDFYDKQPFVAVLDAGEQPNTKNVFGTNFCHIGLVSDKRTGRVIVTCAIDNMGKGAAGQAIQNMNLMCGLDQTIGLMGAAVYP